MIDAKDAAQACKDIERSLVAMPIEFLREAKRRMEIEAHNRAVDEKRAAKKRK